jgi:hypothetical protein
MLAPVPEAPVPEGRLSKREFRIDSDEGTVTCPSGHAVPISTAASGVRRAIFPRAVCRDCPLKLSCCPTMPRRQIELVAEEELLIAARQALNDQATARASAAHQAADRAAARPARPPLSRAPNAVHRWREAPATGLMDRCVGQSEPDQPTTRHPNELRAARPATPRLAPRPRSDAAPPTLHSSRHQPPNARPRPFHKDHLFSGLLATSSPDRAVGV